MHDDFEDDDLSGSWERTEGAQVGLGCGPHHSGHALVFSAAGPRFATTKELDTRNIKYGIFLLVSLNGVLKVMQDVHNLLLLNYL